MTVNQITGPLALEHGYPMPLPAAIGTEIVCEQGAVWITQDHDLRDIVLERGQRFTLDVDAPALVQAFDLATISIRRPADRRPQRRG